MLLVINTQEPFLVSSDEACIQFQYQQFGDPNLSNNQQLNKETEFGEGEGKMKARGKQFDALCLPVHGWTSLGWIAGKQREKRCNP